MKTVIIYSSKTGNTKKIAEAIYNKISHIADIYPIEETPNIDNYDLVVIGFWVHRSSADKKTISFINSVNNKKIALFGTLGAYPDSFYSEKCMNHVMDEVNDSNSILGTFLCQGKIATRLLEKYETDKSLKNNHPMTEERRIRLEKAEKHPDEKDLLDAEKFITNVLKYFNK